ncbi:carboxymuconolactone decarboxylase family protein [Actinoplanes sp. NEAU-A12]|uniref:Carboxymuconolactone decarboxylase family protein n=1 Tax=Actinoplanes sandaracinus TaxID=3045177 RepID=A0ABT6WZU8_9ACTN|nr:carboxymuconolactone decarboxylase family protein [Actinoplanes sandaracinus]MDI6105199.1 carboxymuconolactone decarboxylase family protein [Actinoplanes sandaracinus]
MIPFPGPVRRPAHPRVPPGTRAELGAINAALCRAVARRFGGPVPNILTTLGRHRRLFRSWLRFAARLMPYGTLDRADAELVILRVAVGCGSDYEWHQHVRLARRAGLTAEQIARVGAGPDAPGWSEHQRALLYAADQLIAHRTLDDAVFQRLRETYDERRLIELCLLAGQYAMLAGTLNALGVRPELPDG